MSFFTYLINSKHTDKYDGQAYIGSTPDPARRIRQHNGEISGGARKTKRKRPWAYVLTVTGFSTRQECLWFEWACQHPNKSRYVTDKKFFSQYGGKFVSGNLRSIFVLLNHAPWKETELVIDVYSFHDEVRTLMETYPNERHEFVFRLEGS